MESQGLVKTLLLVCPHWCLFFYLTKAHGGARSKELTEVWDKARQFSHPCRVQQ